MTDTYTIYSQWCRDRGQPAPTREWWDKACTQLRHPPALVDDTSFDIETERREGWTYQ